MYTKIYFWVNYFYNLYKGGDKKNQQNKLFEQ